MFEAKINSAIVKLQALLEDARKATPASSARRAPACARAPSTSATT